MFESKIDKIRGLFALNTLLVVIYLALFGLTASQFAVVLVMFFLMNGVGIVMSFHRFYSHNSFKFRNKGYEYGSLLLGTLSGSGSALGWAGIHRAHHKYSDTDRDPHDAERGFWAMLSLNYSQDFSPRLIAGLYRDKVLVWFHTYYFIPIIIYVVLLGLTFGMAGIVVGFSLPAIMTISAEGATNYINHKDGDEYAASNVWWMNTFSFGDGWHKNHHDKPTGWTTREKWYQLDIMGMVIKHICGKSKNGSSL